MAFINVSHGLGHEIIKSSIMSNLPSDSGSISSLKDIYQDSSGQVTHDCSDELSVAISFQRVEGLTMAVTYTLTDI